MYGCARKMQCRGDRALTPDSQQTVHAKLECQNDVGQTEPQRGGTMVAGGVSPRREPRND